MQKQLSIFIIFISLFTFSSQQSFAQNSGQITLSETHKKNAETIIHLLSYIGRDYPNAVQNGEVISDSEYLEQIEFSQQVQKLLNEGSFLEEEGKEVEKEVQSLMDNISAKSSGEKIGELADNIRNQIISITGMETAPTQWPNLKKGEELFNTTCATCHGITGAGDGAAGQGLDPAPANFLDSEVMNWVSAYQAYNTIKLGVPETGMIAYTNYSEEELWDLAFYVKSLQYKNKSSDTIQLRKVFNNVFSSFSLKEAATLNDEEFLKKFNGDTEKLTAVRVLSPTAENLKSSLVIAKQKLSEALKYYKEGNLALARTSALSAYLEGIEPVEARLQTIDPSFVSKIETQMLKIRQIIEKDQGEKILEQETQNALKLIDDANDLLQKQTLNYWLTFILSLTIVLREGLEAFLVLAVVLLLIRNTGIKKALPWLHGGWITAVLMGILGWFLSDYIIQFGGKNREIMEGLISLIAVIILLFVGFWLHNNSYAHQWQKFIKDKVGIYLQKDKMFGLAAFSFMVVFREAFEVVLFLQAINLEAAAQNKSALGLGVIAAFVLLFVLAVIFLKTSKKIPIRQLFLWSSWIVVLLAVILMGKGIHSLQESGWVSVNSLPEWIRVEWLGIYPSVETISGQLIIILIVAITYTLHNKKMKNIREEKE